MTEIHQPPHHEPTPHRFELPPPNTLTAQDPDEQLTIIIDNAPITMLVAEWHAMAASGLDKPSTGLSLAEPEPYPPARMMYVDLMRLAVERADAITKATGLNTSPQEIRDWVLLWLGSVPA